MAAKPNLLAKVVDMIQAALLFLSLLSFQPIALQDPPPGPTDKRPEIAEMLAKLKAHSGKEGKEDKDAIAVIDQLLQEFQNSGPKDKTAIVKGLSKCFEERRLEREGEAPQNQLYLASATALGQMGPESTDALISWIGHKNHKKDVAVQQRLILSLGETKNKKAIKELVNGLQHPTPTLVSAAAEALGRFEDVDLETRKSAFESLLKVLMSAKGAKDGNVNDGIARERYDVIAAPIITSLAKLSKHDERDPDKWLNWWNKNKRADWDAEQ
ncbi:MAG: HEAT repeat domain-containing protein [Planctomycetota bacterium]